MADEDLSLDYGDDEFENILESVDKPAVVAPAKPVESKSTSSSQSSLTTAKQLSAAAAPPAKDEFDVDDLGLDDLDDAEVVVEPSKSAAPASSASASKSTLTKGTSNTSSTATLPVANKPAASSNASAKSLTSAASVKSNTSSAASIASSSSSSSDESSSASTSHASSVASLKNQPVKSNASSTASIQSAATKSHTASAATLPQSAAQTPKVEPAAAPAPTHEQHDDYADDAVLADDTTTASTTGAAAAEVDPYAGYDAVAAANQYPGYLWDDATQAWIEDPNNPPDPAYYAQQGLDSPVKGAAAGTSQTVSPTHQAGGTTKPSDSNEKHAASTASIHSNSSAPTPKRPSPRQQAKGEKHPQPPSEKSHRSKMSLTAYHRPLPRKKNRDPTRDADGNRLHVLNTRVATAQSVLSKRGGRSPSPIRSYPLPTAKGKKGEHGLLLSSSLPLELPDEYSVAAAKEARESASREHQRGGGGRKDRSNAGFTSSVGPSASIDSTPSNATGGDKLPAISPGKSFVIHRPGAATDTPAQGEAKEESHAQQHHPSSGKSRHSKTARTGRAGGRGGRHPLEKVRPHDPLAHVPRLSATVLSPRSGNPYSYHASIPLYRPKVGRPLNLPRLFLSTVLTEQALYPPVYFPQSQREAAAQAKDQEHHQQPDEESTDAAAPEVKPHPPTKGAVAPGGRRAKTKAAASTSSAATGEEKGESTADGSSEESKQSSAAVEPDLGATYQYQSASAIASSSPRKQPRKKLTLTSHVDPLTGKLSYLPPRVYTWQDLPGIAFEPEWAQEQHYELSEEQKSELAKAKAAEQERRRLVAAKLEKLHSLKSEKQKKDREEKEREESEKQSAIQAEREKRAAFVKQQQKQVAAEKRAERKQLKELAKQIEQEQQAALEAKEQLLKEQEMIRRKHWERAEKLRKQELQQQAAQSKNSTSSLALPPFEPAPLPQSESNGASATTQPINEVSPTPVGTTGAGDASIVSAPLTTEVATAAVSEPSVAPSGENDQPAASSFNEQPSSDASAIANEPVLQEPVFSATGPDGSGPIEAAQSATVEPTVANSSEAAPTSAAVEPILESAPLPVSEPVAVAPVSEAVPQQVTEAAPTQPAPVVPTVLAPAEPVTAAPVDSLPAEAASPTAIPEPVVEVAPEAVVATEPSAAAGVEQPVGASRRQSLAKSAAPVETAPIASAEPVEKEAEPENAPAKPVVVTVPTGPETVPAVDVATATAPSSEQPVLTSSDAPAPVDEIVSPSTNETEVPPATTPLDTPKSTITASTETKPDGKGKPKAGASKKPATGKDAKDSKDTKKPAAGADKKPAAAEKKTAPVAAEKKPTPSAAAAAEKKSGSTSTSAATSPSAKAELAKKQSVVVKPAGKNVDSSTKASVPTTQKGKEATEEKKRASAPVAEKQASTVRKTAPAAEKNTPAVEKPSAAEKSPAESKPAASVDVDASEDYGDADFESFDSPKKTVAPAATSESTSKPVDVTADAKPSQPASPVAVKSELVKEPVPEKSSEPTKSADAPKIESKVEPKVEEPAVVTTSPKTTVDVKAEQPKRATITIKAGSGSPKLTPNASTASAAAKSETKSPLIGSTSVPAPTKKDDFDLDDMNMDDLDAPAATSKPAASKPVEVKPAESKPAEVKPVVAEVKKAADPAKPAAPSKSNDEFDLGDDLQMDLDLDSKPVAAAQKPSEKRASATKPIAAPAAAASKVESTPAPAPAPATTAKAPTNDDLELGGDLDDFNFDAPIDAKPVTAAAVPTKEATKPTPAAASAKEPTKPAPAAKPATDDLDLGDDLADLDDL